MARQQDGLGRVDLEDFIAATTAGVTRAVAARQAGKIHFPIWVGFITNPDWGGPTPWPFPQPGLDQPIPLTARDHTVIVEAATRQALPLLKNLGVLKDRNKAYTPESILRALEQIVRSDEVRNLINRALSSRQRYAGAEDRIDESARSEIDALMTRIRAEQSIDNKIRLLEEAEKRNARDNEGLAVGARTAAAILKSGRATIYNQEFYDDIFGGRHATVTEGSGVITREKSTAEEIVNADVEGAVEGAVAGYIGGSIVGGPLAGVAAAADAAGGLAIAKSVAAGVGAFINWVIS